MTFATFNGDDSTTDLSSQGPVVKALSLGPKYTLLARAKANNEGLFSRKK